MSLLSCKIYNEMYMVNQKKKQLLREEDYKTRQTSISWRLSNNRVQIYNPRKISIYDSLRSSSSSSNTSSVESSAETIQQSHTSFIYNPKTNEYIEYENDEEDENIEYENDEEDENIIDGSSNIITLKDENIIDGSSNIIILKDDGYDTYYYNPIDESYI